MHDPKSKPLTPRAGYVYARASGGHLWHLVPTEGNTSICDHTPRDDPRKSMSRAGWNVLASGECPAGGQTCRTCLSK